MQEKKEFKKQEHIKACGRVEIINTEYKNSKNFEINGIVVGSEAYKTYIAVCDGEIDDITCNCQDYYNHYGVCKHTLATVMTFAEDTSRVPEEENNSSKLNNQYRNFKQIVNTFYNE